MTVVLRFILLTPLLVGQVLLAQVTRPSKSVEPSWVTLNDYHYSNSSLDKQAEDGYVDLVSEHQVNLKDQITYYRRAYKILSEAGVQNNSELSVTYDPSYSRLTFHTIRIIRGNEVINQLDLSKIKTIQQEKELARHSYDGSLSAILFLEDVRKGDVVDYSYSITGFNPIFKGKYSGVFETSFSVPLYNVFYKLIVPHGRSINIKNSLIDIKPGITNTGMDTRYEWVLRDLPAVKTQDNVPSWFDDYSMIMVSEFNSWHEVDQWAANLFQRDIKISGALKKKIDEINSGNTSEDAKIRQALRFVQDDIRYMGIEMGVNSHQPSSPNKIFAQRYGDCKDKSYLLCTMLNAMGVHADPVLINTTYKNTIANWLPAPTNFDHVTVRAMVNNKWYWFDPTISFQRGSIDDISYPDYQAGLVITDTTTTLTAIPLHDKGMTKVKEVFDIPDLYGRAKLVVTTEYSGSFADDSRRSFNANSQDEMKDYARKYYADYFDKIDVDSVSYDDDEITGIFTTKEYYTIHDIWQTSKGKKKVSFEPYVINGAMNKLSDGARKMPFSLSYPARYNEVIEVNMPDDWDGEESEHNVHCKGFRLKSQFSYKNRKFHLEYDYENLKDHIDPSEAEEYVEQYNKANETLAYELSMPSHSPDSISSNSTDISSTKSGGFALFTILFVLVGAIIWAVKRV